MVEVDIVSWAFENKWLNGDKSIWVDAYDTTKHISYTVAQHKVRQMIRGLRYCGLQKGDTVCLHSYNNIYYPLIYLAVIGAQGQFIGSNPAYKTLELGNLFRAAKVKFLMLESSQIDKVYPLALELGIKPENTILLYDDSKFTTLAGVRPWQTLFCHGEEDWHSLQGSADTQSTPAVLLSTSGTTGLPKIVVMSHSAILAQARSLMYVFEDSSTEIRRLISLPFFHSFTLPFHLIALRRGELTFVMPKFDCGSYASFIEKHAITMVPLVPPMAMSLCQRSILAKYDLSSLQHVICAGARLDWETQAVIVRQLHPSLNFCQLWGMSELGYVTAFQSSEVDSTGSVGRLLPLIEAKTIDENGVDTPDLGTIGEIVVSSPGMMLSYVQDLGERKSTKNEGWFRTGDIGYCENGKWYIVDRAKDMIKVRAWQVSPAELEACILLHPAVQDVAVVGVVSNAPGALPDESPVAFVVTRTSWEHEKKVEGDIMSLVAQSLSSYKMISGVVFVDHIPRTVSGKIIRRLLKEKWAPVSTGDRQH